MSVERRRITVRPKQPNPLFEKWLQEWKDEAAARGTDLQYCFAKALASLKKYPLPLQSGKECGILQNFGNRLCVMLDRKLVEYKKLHPEGIPDVPTNCHGNDNLSDGSEPPCPRINIPNNDPKPQNSKSKPLSSPVRKARRKTDNEYIPSYRSGPYAILLALYSSSKEKGYQGFMAKTDVQKAAQPLCDTSFTKPEYGSYYTAWSSMSSLMKKGLVVSVGRGKYSLTEQGETLAVKLQKVNMNDDTDEVLPKDIPIAASSSGVTKQPSHSSCGKGKRKLESDSESTVILAPGSFDIILLIDTQEASGVSGRKGSNDSALNDLQRQKVLSEVRHLKVGDFAWICRERSTGHEVVLPYIIERKRVDDFAQSIMDGRFREQKFRLKQCGLPNLIYLVEKHGKESHTVLPLATLNQAAANTEVTDGFIVKYTGNHKESTAYLASFTHVLVDLFRVKTLVTCQKKNLPPFSASDDMVSLMSFQEFNSSSIKNKKLGVRDMFIKHLVQLNGVSVEKALAMVERYPSPQLLYRALNGSRDTKMLAEIPFGSSNRRIGPVISKAVFELYTNATLM